MSELIINPQDKLARLQEFANRFILGEKGKNLIEEFEDVIALVTPDDTMQVFHYLLNEGHKLETVKLFAGKIMHVFFMPLEAHEWEKPKGNHILNFLMQENREVEQRMTNLQLISRMISKESTPELEQRLKDSVAELKAYDLHYIKMENIVFPFIEKTFEAHACLQIMWSFHDDFRAHLKALDQLISEKNYDVKERNILLGKLFFSLLPIIFREEQVVFPVAYRSIPQKAWDQMLAQSIEAGWCYIDAPTDIPIIPNEAKSGKEQIDLNSGELYAKQIIGMLNNLPVDITFIDENDEVRYFSEGPSRIFPRSKAIIGRKVQNCHPPDSVHMVNEIIAAFRAQEKSEANFWLQMQGKFLYIRYFSIIQEGEYKGTIEVSQEVTDIRALEGERKLLEWE